MATVTIRLDRTLEAGDLGRLVYANSPPGCVVAISAGNGEGVPFSLIVLTTSQDVRSYITCTLTETVLEEEEWDEQDKSLYYHTDNGYHFYLFGVTNREYGSLLR